MNKLLLIAVGIATAAAQFTYEYSPFYVNNMENSYLDFNFNFATDLYYTTTYGGANQ